MYVFSTKKYLITEILVASLIRFLLVEIPGKQKYTYLVIVNFIFKRVNVDDIYIYIYIKSFDLMSIVSLKKHLIFSYTKSSDKYLASLTALILLFS